MAPTKNETELRYEAPGPGSWELDPVHFPRPATRYWAETQPDALKRGVQDFTRFYGLLIDTLDYRYVNGFAYRSLIPVAETDVPQRLKRADEVFRGKLWREQLREWDETIRPASIKVHRALQSIDCDALSDQELLAHLTRCRDHHAAMISQHMRFTAAAIVPTGDFLAHVGDWTGASPAELLGLLRGAAPVSAGASTELARLISTVGKDARAQELLMKEDEPGRILQTLRAIEGEIGQAATAYLDLVGYRLLDGFDISEPCALELPAVLLRAIRTAISASGNEPANLEERIAAVRSKVPDLHRAEFDELLGEARLTYRIRDERGVFSDIWASGIMRTAVLAGGRRLAKKGQIQNAVHLVDASFQEMGALLRGAESPSSEELASRAEYRASHRAKQAPALLGPPPSSPPDMSALPPNAARMMRAVHIALGELFGSSEAAHEEKMLRGLAASPGIYEGPARRVSNPSEFDRIVQGDVLVTESTSEAFNIILPLLGAIVTDSGGLLSHSAIVAREYGIPGVVGTREATERIADGVLVRVDGAAGQVTIFE